MLSKITELDLLDQVFTTSRKSPAARNRFIYYPDHLVKIPTLDLSSITNSINSITKLFQTLRAEPLFMNALSGFLLEPTQPSRPPSEWQEDESIASFISRRFHPNIAENLLSAVMHGIYAGDIDQLSAQTILGSLRNLDDVGIFRGMFDRAVQQKMSAPMDDFIGSSLISRTQKSEEFLPERADVVRASTFTLKGGTQQLVEGLETALRKSDKVKIMTGTDIKSMTQRQGSDSISVSVFSCL